MQYTGCFVLGVVCWACNTDGFVGSCRGCLEVALSYRVARETGSRGGVMQGSIFNLCLLLFVLNFTTSYLGLLFMCFRLVYFMFSGWLGTP